MRILGSREVDLASLVLPDDMPARQKTSSVGDLAEDLKRWGRYINDPLVREEDNRVIAGRDRIAGMLRAGLKRGWVKFAECTDEEAELLELAENLHRRQDDQVELRRRWLDTIERQVRLERDAKPEKVAHRPASPRGEARKRLADQLGVSKRAIEKIDQQPAPARGWGDDDEGDASSAPAPVGPCIKDYEIGVPPTVDARARRVQVAIDEADGLLLKVAKIVNALEETGLSGKDADRIKDAYGRFAHELRGLRPEALCPWCKAIKSAGCAGCYETGFAIASKLRADIPEELTRSGAAAMVAENGRYRLLKGGEAIEIIGGAASRAPLDRKLGRARRLRVEGPDGERLDVPPPDDDDGMAF